MLPSASSTAMPRGPIVIEKKEGTRAINQETKGTPLKHLSMRSYGGGFVTRLTTIIDISETEFPTITGKDMCN